jgi:hypothetical protein
MMIRLSEEFGFNVTAFHHALEAWKIAPLLGSKQIGAAIFSDHWGFKKDAGVPVALKSDHPVINSQVYLHVRLNWKALTL